MRAEICRSRPSLPWSRRLRRAADRRVPAQDQPDLNRHAGPFGPGEQVSRLRSGQGGWLFDDERLAGVERGGGDRMMGVGGGDDVHQVDPMQSLTPITDRPCASHVRRRIAAPCRRADPLRPEFRGEVRISDPNTSGTAHTMLAIIVQPKGEVPAFDHLRALHRDVNQYTRLGITPARAVATGETLVGINVLHDAMTRKVADAPVQIVAPCQGTGYEMGSMTIIKGARNLDHAKRCHAWALTAEAQAIGATATAYQIPSTGEAPIPPEAPRFAGLKSAVVEITRRGQIRVTRAAPAQVETGDASGHALAGRVLRCPPPVEITKPLASQRPLLSHRKRWAIAKSAIR